MLVAFLIRTKLRPSVGAILPIITYEKFRNSFLTISASIATQNNLFFISFRAGIQRSCTIISNYLKVQSLLNAINNAFSVNAATLDLTSIENIK